jgi:hypothetical protein
MYKLIPVMLPDAVKPTGGGWFFKEAALARFPFGLGSKTPAPP